MSNAAALARRSSLAVMHIENPQPCTTCPPGTSPHSVRLELRFRRGSVLYLQQHCELRVVDAIDAALFGFADLQAHAAVDTTPTEEELLEKVAQLQQQVVLGARLIGELEQENADLALELQQSTDAVAELETRVDALCGAAQ